jgi:hypothetical protein
MRWAIKHKSGRTLFVTSDEFIANNRRKMGWIVEEVKMTSREQFEQKINHAYGEDYLVVNDDGDYVNWITADLWEFWVASRSEIEIQACPCPNDHGPNVDDHYREQINNAGLKVKK